MYLKAYKFTKEKSCFSISEFVKKTKEKNYFKKKSFQKGAIFQNGPLSFLAFSFFQGVMIMEMPIWSIKALFVVFKDARKNKKEGFRNLYGWRKLYDAKQKVFIYYPFVIGFK